MTEIEARWINLEREKAERRLKEIGAEKVSESFFREWVFSYEEWLPKNQRIRIRDDGTTVWLSYKANLTYEVDGTEEVETTIASATDMLEIIGKIGIPLRRHQEKKRVKYVLRDITFDLDFWPKIPMVLEIEAPEKEKVMEGSKLLGLSWEDAIFVDQKALHRQYYGIDLDLVTEYKFPHE